MTFITHARKCVKGAPLGKSVYFKIKFYYFSSNTFNVGTQNNRLNEAFLLSTLSNIKVSKGAKIRNRYNQVSQLTQDTNGKVTNSQLDATNESQEVSLFPAGDHKAHLNRRTKRHSKHKTE